MQTVYAPARDTTSVGGPEHFWVGSVAATDLDAIRSSNIRIHARSAKGGIGVSKLMFTMNSVGDRVAVVGEVQGRYYFGFVCRTKP